MYPRYHRPALSSVSACSDHDSPTFGDDASSQAAGVPRRRLKVSGRDIGVSLVQIVCLLAALLTVFYQPLAVWLGQLNQLIVLGLILGIMALFLQELVLQTTLIVMGYRRSTTLQDLDCFLRKDMLAPQIPLYYRVILLLLVGLPLGLSASYKLFVGGVGHSTVTSFPAGTFGYSAVPGNQRIGDGLTLLSDIYRPFWIDPSIKRSYGFNLYIASNETAVVPDTPYPAYLSSIQSTLQPGELIKLQTTVNATVSTLANPSASERNSSDYWNAVADKFGHDATISASSGVSGANNALLAGMGANVRSNFSVAFYSAWNTTRNESFYSEALRIENYRALYHVSWNISSTSANLTSCRPVQSTITDLTTAMDPSLRNANQTLIQYQFLGIQEIFTPFLGEYDWHNRGYNGAFDYPYPGPSDTAERWAIGVNSVPALSASMLWARTTSYNGGDRPNRNRDLTMHTMYSKSTDQIQMVKTIPTLKRSGLLAVVICANPVLALPCLVLKLLMWRSPIDASFNLVSLLAAARGAKLDVLKGAGLSGSLERTIGVRFFVDHKQSEEEGKAFLGLELDASGQASDRLARGFTYG